jgi:hypothetical protein
MVCLLTGRRWLDNISFAHFPVKFDYFSVRFCLVKMLRNLIIGTAFMGAYLCVREYRLSVKLQDLNNAEFIDSNLRPTSKPTTLRQNENRAFQEDFKKLQDNAADVISRNTIHYRMNTLSYRPPARKQKQSLHTTYKRAPLALPPPLGLVSPPLGLVSPPLALVPPSPRVVYPSVAQSIGPSPSIRPVPSLIGKSPGTGRVLSLSMYNLFAGTSLTVLLFLFYYFCCAKSAPTHNDYINREPRPVLPTIRRRAVSPGTAAGHHGWVEEDDVRIVARNEWWQTQEQQMHIDNAQRAQNLRQQQLRDHQRTQERLAYYYTHRND